MDLSHLRDAASGRGVLAYLVRHRTAANLLLLVAIVAGLAAGTRLRTQFFPDIVIESVTVRVPWSSAGPQDIDDAIAMGDGNCDVENVASVTTNEGVTDQDEVCSDIDYNPDIDLVKSVTATDMAGNGALDQVGERELLFILAPAERVVHRAVGSAERRPIHAEAGRDRQQGNLRADGIAISGIDVDGINDALLPVVLAFAAVGLGSQLG